MKLGNYIKLISGQHIDVVNCNKDNLGIPYLTGPADFIGKTPKTSKFTNQPKVICEKGDILVTVKGSGTGSIAIADQKYCISRQLMAIRCLRINPLFTQYLVENYEKKFNSKATGLIPGISRSDVLGVKVPPILLPEQIIIAGLLSTWDQAIEKTERLIAAKEKLFSGLIMSMISNQCDSWEHLRSDKIFKSISDKCNAGAELLSVTQDRGVIPRTMLAGRVMSPIGSTDSYKLIKAGDFAISLRSFQGGIEYSEYHGLISPAYTVLRPKLKIVDDFFRHFFKSYLFIEKYLSIAVIGIRDGKQISIPDFMTVKIPYPRLETQKEIASILNITRQEIDLLKKQLGAYGQQKRGLMQKLLTGQWRVKISKGV